jgi:2-dehydropantoate 2-reductase
VRVAIAGAGGVGGLLAGLLARSGTEVSLLARGEHLRAIQKDGLRVETPEETFTVRVDASESATGVPKASVLLVAVKTWQLPALLPQLESLLEAGGVAVPLLNGIEAAGILAARVGEERVCGGLCHLFAWIQGPGVVRRAGVPPRVTVGELLFVGPLGAVGAAARVPAGRLRTVPETRALLERAMREVQSVARAAGASIPDAAISGAMSRVDSLPAEGTTSMHRDLVSGKRSELDDLVGAVVRAGASRKVPVPVHETLYGLLLPHELAAREGRRDQ